MRSQAHTRWFLLAALAAAFLLAWPVLAQPGLLNTRGGGDSPFLLQRLHQLVTAVADGHFPVRWMPDANYGYGYPFYNFYAPLSIYIAAFFRLLGFSFVRSIHLAQLAGFLAAAAAMFFLARRWFQSKWAGLLASLAYSAAPFHLVNIYVRGDSLAEFWAMAFYPLTLLAVDTIFDSTPAHTRQQRQTAVALLALTYAALILSHNISALIFSPFLLLYILLRLLTHHRLPLTDHRKPITDHWPSLLAALILAFALAAWFFIPALAEKDLAQLGPVTEGYFHFSNHFLGSAQRPLLQTTFFFNYAVDGFEAFRMGLVQTIAILAGLMVLLLTWRRSETIRPYRRLFILLSLLLSTFMLLPLANWLWQVLPLLSFTQFPWRFLSVQAFAGALATGALALLPWRKVIVPLTAVLLLVAALGNLKTDHLILNDADVTAEKLAQYEWFSGNIGSTVSAEYLPTNVQPRMFSSGWLHNGNRQTVTALQDSLQSAQPLETKTSAQSWQISVANDDNVVFPLLFWPGWQARVDGRPAAIQAAPGSGLVQLPLPAGKHLVELKLTRTPIQLLAELVSVTAVIILIWLGVDWANLTGLLKRQKRPAIALLGSLVVLIILAQIWPQRPLSDGNLTWDFGQMAYLSHSPNGILFTDGSVLNSYQFSQETVGPGDELTITTNWSGVSPSAPITLELTTPAVNRYQEPSPPIVAAQTETIANGRATFNLFIPENAPGGLMVPRLLTNGRALTPAGTERGALFLRPLLLENSGSAVAATTSLDVKAIEVQQRNPTTLDIHLAWYTEKPLTQNYNVALRLTDANGQFLQLADMQPGYGFQPSSLWPAARWSNDWLALTLPAADHEMPYVLIAQLIDITHPNQPVLTRRLGELWPDGDTFTFRANEPQFKPPTNIEMETAVTFANALKLASYTIAQNADSLQLHLVWQSLAQMDKDVTRFVHLIPANSSQPQVVQDDNMPGNGTYPTSQWTPGEFISEQINLSLTVVPAGEYQLLVGFYEQLPDGSFPRLTAVAPNGSPLPNNQYLIPDIIHIP